MKNCYSCSYCGAIFEDMNICTKHEQKHIFAFDIESTNYDKDRVYPTEIKIHFQNNQRLTYRLVEADKQRIIF